MAHTASRDGAIPLPCLSHRLRVEEREAAMKVSVCLASYRGEAFIKEQLTSILADLDSEDEIVVSDDHSGDRTVDIVRSIDDDRIKLHPFTNNVRHIRNFERAIGLATGDLIFLADQDDIWVRGKRDRVVAEFARSPDISMVVHALALIDTNGRVIAPRSHVWASKAAGRQSTIPYLLRQIVKNQVTGCAVAFRRELLPVLLPFPSAVYAHDHWLSVVAPFMGAVVFLDVPLVQYRQHAANVTPRGGLSPRGRVIVRAQLAMLAAIAASRAFRRHHETRSD